jgi:hypothetical protein
MTREALIAEAERFSGGNEYLERLWLSELDDDSMSYESFVELAQTDPSFLG